MNLNAVMSSLFDEDDMIFSSGTGKARGVGISCLCGSGSGNGRGIINECFQVSMGNGGGERYVSGVGTWKGCGDG